MNIQLKEIAKVWPNIQEHGLKQSDLPEIGSQGVVSEIISGKRQLNVCQLKLLGERFKVSPVVFV